METAMKRGFMHMLAILLATLFGSASDAAAADKVLTVAASVFPDNLKAGTLTYAGLSLVAQTNDFLVARDNRGDLQPALATSWEAIDPTTMRFRLRQGVKFKIGRAHV